jgi:FkbM family methyltransferase
MYSVFKNKQDAFEIELLKKHIKKGDTVLDIGANIGFYATILSNIVGEKGKIHCFEPDATNFSHLQKTVSSYKNIIINNKAVGPKTEKIKIYTSKELNVDHRTYKPEEYDEEIEIDAVNIDDYLKSTKVDFIKMDIQGFEMEAMKGMKETLKNNPDIKMISEFWPYGLKKAGSSLRDYFVLLKELNFKIEILRDNKLETLDLETVLEMENFPEENYFNILVTPNVQ